MNWYKQSQLKINKQLILNVLKQAPDALQGSIYNSITERPGYQQQFQQMDPQHDQAYRGWVSTWANDGNGAWCQRNISNMGQKDANRNSFKFYMTPSDESINTIANNIGSLIQGLEQIAQQFQTTVSFKMPCTLGQWYKINDRIVIHYYDQNAKNAIEQFATQWANNSGASLEPRAYTRGIDQEGQGSFSQRISNQIATQALGYRQQGYDDNQVADWIVNMIQQTYAQEPSQF